MPFHADTTSPRRPTGHETPTFSRYAEWYDAFNQAKPYDAEADYVLRRVEALAGAPRRWLDIGCGTGHHLSFLQARGIVVEGLDRSPAMLARARAAHPDIGFQLGTAQELPLDGNRDVISMLFHVMSYQVDEGIVAAAFERIASHLAPTGLFIFDFWNSEAVRRDPPTYRTRVAHIDGRPMYRLSTPVEDRGRSLITVHFEFRWDSPTGALIHEESHVQRHFSASELGRLLRGAGLSPVSCEAWMTEQPLTEHDWYGFICARPERER